MAARKKGKDAKPNKSLDILKADDTTGKDNRRDKESVKILYMASPHLSWAPFAESIGLHPHASIPDYPTNLWKAEKRKKIIDEEKEKLKDSVVDMMGVWSADVRNTLKKYPQVADAALGLIIEKIKSMQQDVVEDTAKKDGKSHRVKMWEASQLNSLASAINIITQAKHRSLMIDQFAVDMTAMIESASQIPQDLSKIETHQAIEVVIKSIGTASESRHERDHQEKLATYYDWNIASKEAAAPNSVPVEVLPEGVPLDAIEALMKEAENS